jgi:hypothetical protein
MPAAQAPRCVRRARYRRPGLDLPDDHRSHLRMRWADLERSLQIGRYAGLRPSHAAKAIAELIELGKLFRTDDGKLFNRFADNELVERAELGEKRAAAGSKGGRSRVQGGANGDQSGRNGDQGGKKPEARKRRNGGKRPIRRSNCFYARAREEKRREERIPPTPQTDEDGDGQKPDEPLTAEDRARLAR